ncbi:MAG: LacI family transcriptional regulator [Phycisphaerales bacterium]|jgi:LacI family transcriptional regulator|nr:LacI family transcriptional regulator [Phycisphaerales bacterium]
MANVVKRNGPPAVPRVALLIETTGSAGRDILRGVARYARESGPWALRHEPRSQQFTEGWVPSWLDGWQGNGVLGRFETDAIVDAVRHANVPAVDLLGVRRDLPFPLVIPDDLAIGRLAAEHLLERGFRQFGYIGWQNERWSDQRGKAFKEKVAERGCECATMELPTFKTLPESWDAFIEDLVAWIKQRPKPLGLMLCYDHVGPPVTQACREAGVAVPEEVAIVGVDNNDVVCAICDPPLSSVCPNHEEVGYQGAALLDRIMTGGAAPAGPIVIPPRTVVVRQSSSVSAIEDPVVSAALSMIREHACNGLQVRDVAENVPVSRSVLQRRFQAVLGRSVHNEIVRVQLRKAQELLKETDLSVRTIAEKAGFKHPEYMAAVFKHRVGVTPVQYRRRYQMSESSYAEDPRQKSRPPLARA